MLEGIGAVGAIVLGSKIAKGGGNAISGIKRMNTGLKKWSKPVQPKKSNFKKKTTVPHK